MTCGADGKWTGFVPQCKGMSIKAIILGRQLLSCTVWPDGYIIFQSLAIFNSCNLPRSNKMPNNCSNTFKILLKWRNFAKSGHNGPVLLTSLWTSAYLILPPGRSKCNIVNNVAIWTGAQFWWILKETHVREFESHCQILDGPFFTFACCKIVLWFEMTENKCKRDSTFLKYQFVLNDLGYFLLMQSSLDATLRPVQTCVICMHKSSKLDSKGSFTRTA